MCVMKKILLTALSSSLFMVACTHMPAKTDAVPDMHTAEISLDWSGVYEGTLPCADCVGINTKLELFQDKTYRLAELYLTNRPGQKLFEYSGKFEFDKTNPALIRLDSTPDNRLFFIGEGYLEVRDRETGQPLDSKLNYKLMKK